MSEISRNEFFWLGVIQGILVVAAFGRSGGAASVLLSGCHTGLFLLDWIGPMTMTSELVHKLPCRTFVQRLKGD